MSCTANPKALPREPQLTIGSCVPGRKGKDAASGGLWRGTMTPGLEIRPSPPASPRLQPWVADRRWFAVVRSTDIERLCFIGIVMIMISIFTVHRTARS